MKTGDYTTLSHYFLSLTFFASCWVNGEIHFINADGCAKGNSLYNARGMYVIYQPDTEDANAIHSENVGAKRTTFYVRFKITDSAAEARRISRFNLYNDLTTLVRLQWNPKGGYYYQRLYSEQLQDYNRVSYRIETVNRIFQSGNPILSHIEPKSQCHVNKKKSLKDINHPSCQECNHAVFGRASTKKPDYGFPPQNSVSGSMSIGIVSALVAVLILIPLISIITISSVKARRNRLKDQQRNSNTEVQMHPYSHGQASSSNSRGHIGHSPNKRNTRAQVSTAGDAGPSTVNQQHVELGDISLPPSYEQALRIPDPGNTNNGRTTLTETLDDLPPTYEQALNVYAISRSYI